MDVKFCVAGCHQPAIRAARSSDYCREHYRAKVLAHATDLLRCEVTATRGSRGQLAGVTDCLTQETVRGGSVVVLDPSETNVAALVAGGTVKVLGPHPEAPKTAKKG